MRNKRGEKLEREEALQGKLEKEDVGICLIPLMFRVF